MSKLNCKSLYLNIVFFTLIGCSNAFVVKNKKKTIILNEIDSNNTKIGFENSLVIVKITISDLIKYMSEFDSDSKEMKDKIKSLKSIQKDTIFDLKTNNNFDFHYYKYFFHQIILDKKAIIIQKSNNQNLKKIKYHFIEDRLGGQQASFSFQDGTEFFYLILSFGE